MYSLPATRIRVPKGYRVGQAAVLECTCVPEAVMFGVSSVSSTDDVKAETLACKRTDAGATGSDTVFCSLGEVMETPPFASRAINRMDVGSRFVPSSAITDAG